jgi:hypothetical protein
MRFLVFDLENGVAQLHRCPLSDSAAVPLSPVTAKEYDIQEFLTIPQEGGL